LQFIIHNLPAADATQQQLGNSWPPAAGHG